MFPETLSGLKKSLNIPQLKNTTLAILCDLFGMVSLRDPFNGYFRDLQRLWIKFGHGLNHLVQDAWILLQVIGCFW